MEQTQYFKIRSGYYAIWINAETNKQITTKTKTIPEVGIWLWSIF